MSRSRWNVLPSPPNLAVFISAGFSPVLSRILFHRGITHPSQVDDFLEADSRLSGDPFLLPSMDRAVARLYRAMLSGEKIAVFGDFDTDGVTSTALMVQGLALLGVDAIPYIPHRMTEGYGLKLGALESLRKQGVSLVVSVDCGVTALEAVKRSKRFGLDIIVTDHHVPLADIPDAVAVVDPKLPSSAYPFSDLSGAGVALKVMQALFSSLGRKDGLDQVLDLVALGTVADVVPVLGENRFLVKEGLARLNGSARVGVRELAVTCGYEDKTIDTGSISWALAPRLNAAGRLEHAMSSYRLLMTQSSEEARELAQWLHKKNSERQDLTAKAMQTARGKLEAGVPAVVIGDDDFPIGICGLVAGRLCEETYRPAVVARTGEKLSSGSCRSIPEFNIINAMTRFQAEVGGLVNFGGHAQAAGFTLPTGDLPKLRDFLCKLAEEELAGADLRPRVDVDAEVKLFDLGGDVFPTIQKLEPFGEGNPSPTFLSRRVQVVEHRTMGKGDHLTLKLKQGGVVWNAVGFGLGNQDAALPQTVDIVYNVEVDHWNGSARLRLNIVDFDRSN